MEIDEGSAGVQKEIGCGGAEKLIKLNPGSSISVRYHREFGQHDELILLEADDKLLQEILSNRVTIRGQPDEDAVLCTSSATYAMKFVGTSNSVFLVPPGEPNLCLEIDDIDREGKDHCSTQTIASVFKLAPGHMEVVQVAPRLEKLKSLLYQTPYRLEEDLSSDSEKKGLYRWRDLVDQIQASDEELQAGLESLSAAEIDGYWRIIDKRSMDDILSMILTNSVLQEWPLSALPEDDVLSVLEVDGFPRIIVLHCLKTYGNRNEDMECPIWCLDEKKVCLRLALRLLCGGKMKLETFMHKWDQAVPTGMGQDIKMLEGEVLFEKIGVETWIRPFSVSELPLVPADRFAALFQERAKWEWKDLEPYIRDLRVPGLSSEALLIKYTRRIQPRADVEPIFTAR